jgi:hypothetical protein
MFHRLLAGFFDEQAAASRRGVKVVKPLEIAIVLGIIHELGIEGDGESFRVGNDVMTIQDGYVDCPWLTVQVNRKAVEFMLRLNQETGCRFLHNYCEIIDVQELKESLGG